MERADFHYVEKLRRLKRFVPFEDLVYSVSSVISEELFSSLSVDATSAKYIAWGPLLSFIMGVFRMLAPHDYRTLDRVLDILLDLQGSRLIFEYIFNALACRCKTASLVLTECPYSGSCPDLALVCHMLRQAELMILWWKLSDFEFLFEGLQCMMPCVWWPGSSEDMSYESNMMLTTTALSEAVSKIEEKHRDLCRLVMEFIPPTAPQLPGSVFRTFLQNLIFKNKGIICRLLEYQATR